MPRPPEEPNQPHDPIEDEFDDIPLHQKRPFGSGLHKKRITFVPASSSLQTVSDAPTAAAKPPSGSTISDLYLNLVLPPSTPPIIPEQKEGVSTPSPPPPISTEKKEDPPLCPSCHLPILPNHSLSLPHQLSLPHSHPPSSLNRTRMGLTYLSSHGWDPDSRKGLGPNQQGIQYPLKPNPKNDKLGLGVEVPKGTAQPPPVPKEKKLLDAKKVRKMYQDDKKRKEGVMRELFGNGKVEKYLGSGAG